MPGGAGSRLFPARSLRRSSPRYRLLCWFPVRTPSGAPAPLRRRAMEVEPPGLLRYLLGALVMVVGVVLPLVYMMFRGQRPPSSASYFSKQTNN